MKLHTGHVLDVLATLPERSVQCIMTSPPYWGLRKYAGEQEVVWGGKEGCEHEWGAKLPIVAKVSHGTGGSTLTGGHDSWGNRDGGSQGSFCSLCGAWRGAFGLEPTPALYIEHSMMVLDALWRVLRDDGVLWWNLADSYNGSGGAGGDYNDGGLKEGQPRYPGRKVNGLKPKDLCLIPFRFALAAQERGWWVRSDIIWSKPNPMPESVTDRPTRAHEYIFLLTKAARYYYDAEAVKEPMATASMARYGYAFGGAKNEYLKATDKPTAVVGNREATDGRNLRSVWHIATQPYPEAHFATFPPELPRRCILASTRPRDVVLDPFCGSGTTVQVAEELNREGWGIDISKEYQVLQGKRIAPWQGQKRLI